MVLPDEVDDAVLVDAIVEFPEFGGFHDAERVLLELGFDRL